MKSLSCGIGTETCNAQLRSPTPNKRPRVACVTICVLFNANDAYMRDYEPVIPSDCVVSNTPKENDDALALMRKCLKAKTPRGSEVELREPEKADVS